MNSLLIIIVGALLCVKDRKKNVYDDAVGWKERLKCKTIFFCSVCTRTKSSKL